MSIENMPTQIAQWMPVAQFASYYMGFCDRVDDPFLITPDELETYRHMYDEDECLGSTYYVWNSFVEFKREFPMATLGYENRINIYVD